jgi:DNA-directed RNA polymerase specialized sigma24 family protein
MVSDAVHDSFLKVRHLWGRSSADTHRPLAWLVAVAYGCLRDQLRYAIRRQARRASLDTVEHHVVPLPPSAVERVHETLTWLSHRQAHALHSHYLAGKTLLEMSSDLDVSPAAVHSLLQRSRHRFRELWVVTEDVPIPTSGGAV